MSHLSNTAQIEKIVSELVVLYLAQAANLREYARAAVAEECAVHLERILRRRKVQLADLYCQFKRAAFPEGWHVRPLPGC
jgi:hypothetical protein